MSQPNNEELVIMDIESTTPTRYTSWQGLRLRKINGATVLQYLSYYIAETLCGLPKSSIRFVLPDGTTAPDGMTVTQLRRVWREVGPKN
jgi:hypothetical protein